MHKKALFANIFSVAIISVALGLCSLTHLHAGVYKWVDESGQVHYGSRPGNSNAETVTIRQNETTKPRAIKKPEEDEETEKEAEDKAKTEAEVPQISKKEKRKYCNEAKSDLKVIKSRGRLREIDEKGQYSYLSEKQRQQRISAAKKKQREFCR